MVLAKFTPNGEITWVTRDGGTGDDHVFGVLAEPRGRIITTGFAANQVLYRTVDGVPVTLTTYGGEDAFINGYVDPARSNGVNGQDWLMYE